MPEDSSQSIKSDRISKSTIARIAGNLLSGMSRTLPLHDDMAAVRWAVLMAHRIAREVEDNKT